MPRLAIIGLGLIGGSLGLALKRAQLKGLEIAGYDREWDVGGRARKLGAIDVDARVAPEAAEGAAVVVLATPISQFRATLEAIAPALAAGAIVTDVASTKREVLRWARELMPEGAHFVGGHPIAGKEHAGLDAAEASLFDGRPWAITPSVEAAEAAVRTIENLIATVGAEPVIIDAEEHDSYLAAVSHLPLVAASALFLLARESQAWPELGVLAGPGFRDTTRLASTPPALSHDISLTNRENLLHWLDRYVDELRRWRGMIAHETQEELSKAFAKAQTERDAFVAQPPARPRPATRPETESAGERLLTLMLGEYAVRRAKEVEQIIRQREDDAAGRKR
jgi:prephenate dehydrogenase